jgi:hypothetical protein
MKRNECSLLEFLWTHAIVSHYEQGTAAKSKKTMLPKMV